MSAPSRPSDAPSDSPAAELNRSVVLRQYQTLVENAQDALFFIDVGREDGDDLSFRYLRFNATLEELTGLSTDDVRGRTPREALGEETGAQVEDDYRRCVEKGQSIEYEETLTFPAGTKTWHTKLSPVVVEGTVTRIVGIARDVTERKKTETALQQSEELHRATLSNITDAVFITREDGTFTYVCPNVSYIFGYSQEQVEELGSISALLGTDPRMGQDFGADGEISNVDQTVADAHGDPHHLLINVRRVSIREGSVLYTCRDITERKAAEQELRRHRERLATAQQMAGLGSWERDFETDTLYRSGEAERIFGWDDEEEITYDKFLSAVHPEDRDEVRHALQRAIREEEAIDHQYRIVRPDGEERIIRERGRPTFDEEGNLVRFSGAVLDVTEQKRTEAELRESERRYRSLAEQTSDIITRHAADGTVLYVSPAVERVLGYAPDDLIGRDPYEVIHPEDRERVRLVHESLLEGEGERVECREIRADGSFVWVELIARRVSAEGGTSELVISTRPIEERKEAEQELRRSRERYKSLFEGSNDAIFIHDVEGRIQNANPKAVEMFGYSQDEFTGLTVPDLHPSDRQDVVREKLGAVRRGESVRAEIELLRSDETTFWGEISAAPFDVADEKLVLSMVRDVTERKEAEAQLKKSRERWRQLIERQRDAVQITVDGVIRYANPAGVELVGADSEEELIGRHVREFVVSEEAEAEVEKRAEQIKQGIPTEPYEHEIERLDGERRIVESYAVPIEHEGRQAAQGIIRDVTERKRTQRQLQQAQKMETVGQLAGGIAHDFNNILHAVTAYVQMVEEELPEEGPNRMLLGRALQALGRAEGLVERLLTFSRREERSSPPEPVDLAATVQEALELVEPSLPKGVTVRTELRETCTVQGDAGKLHQVATNLLTNAGQAMEHTTPAEERVLDVDLRPIDVGDDLARRHLGLEPGRYVRLSISDTGPGMDEETKERIFEPFFTTKEVGEGTGLGLSVVHGVVQSCGGEIVVYTEPGKGTTFDVYLPCGNEGDASSDGTADEPLETSIDRGRVLFVDDEKPIRELEALRLRRIGCEVTVRESAQEALRTWDEAPEAFDLVVTDYAMPGKDGIELTRALREAGYEGPVVLMSGFSAQVSPDRAEAAGVTEYLRKPVGTDELEEILTGLLQ